VEAWFMDQLVELYGVDDEDQLPIPFDFLELLDTDKEDRESVLKDKLADCPQGADATLLGNYVCSPAPHARPPCVSPPWAERGASHVCMDKMHLCVLKLTAPVLCARRP
jgi:hypothetical protein